MPLQKWKPGQVAGTDSVGLTSTARVLWSTKLALSVCFVCLLCLVSHLQASSVRSRGQRCHHRAAFRTLTLEPRDAKAGHCCHSRMRVQLGEAASRACPAQQRQGCLRPSLQLPA